jgi:hypothetical protein
VLVNRAVIGGGLLVLSLVLCGCTSGGGSVSVPAPGDIPLSESERAAAYSLWEEQARAELLERFPEAEVPVVAFVRFISPNEYGTTMADCATERGFPAEATADGGVRYGQIPPQQAEDVAVATYSCAVQYPVDPVYQQPLNQEQLAYLYDYYVNQLAPWLEEQGYSTPNPPSEATFTDRYESGEPWTPYATIDAPSEDAWYELLRACPQEPGSLFGPGT